MLGIGGGSNAIEVPFVFRSEGYNRPRLRGGHVKRRTRGRFAYYGGKARYHFDPSPSLSNRAHRLAGN